MLLSKIIKEDEIRKAKKYIEKGSSFAIVIHSAPDGDAIGSSLGLFHFLGTLGKDKVHVIAPNDFPAYYKWLSGSRDIVMHDRYPDFAEHLIRDADVVFCLDFNEPRRVGKLASALVATEARRVMIDHHLNPEDFCRVTMSYPQISSTSEMIFRLICRMGMYDLLSKPAAEAIYTGMMSDTGAFTFNSNHPEIYTIIENLIRKGIDKDQIYRRVNQVYSENRMRMMGYVLYEKMKIYPKSHTALITLTQQDLRRFRYTTGDTEGFVNMPLSIDGIIFSAFLREDPENIKVSLRSSGNFPCNEFAATGFNGGGHKNAAGGEFKGTMQDAIALFEKTLNAYTDPT
ncbi:MAG: bifunctional oligoribonuclease/PAP phosphatase NrnA [Tannerellaceae bacterium]|jgi:phosphoesterase RecJ-like protein|nr:bifunctional oligoribonuclease/PAP phosphatase NrnA [Tannerellaceae bacterium]